MFQIDTHCLSKTTTQKLSIFRIFLSSSDVHKQQGFENKGETNITETKIVSLSGRPLFNVPTEDSGTLFYSFGWAHNLLDILKLPYT